MSSLSHYHPHSNDHRHAAISTYLNASGYAAASHLRPGIFSRCDLLRCFMTREMLNPAIFEVAQVFSCTFWVCQVSYTLPRKHNYMLLIGVVIFCPNVQEEKNETSGPCLQHTKITSISGHPSGPPGTKHEVCLIGDCHSPCDKLVPERFLIMSYHHYSMYY